MDKNAIKKYAIYARNKLKQSATDKALTIGVSKNEIREPDVQGDNYIIFTSSLGTETTLTGDQIDARNNLINEINNKGFDEVIKEVAYTWFNRLIAIRFMEVNDYLPSRLRVLSSDISGKKESDLMSNPFDADLNLTNEDKKNIITYKENNNLNELFNLLFVKQCNKLNELLPGLFERTNEFTELLLDIRYDDSEDVVYKLVHDIPEEDFDVSKGGQVEIIGWLYQYYNTEPKDEVFKGLKKNKKITKENVPAATQLFTPDWIVRYMVENSLGRLWIEHLRGLNPQVDERETAEKFGWKYYLPEAKQEPEVEQQLAKIREEYATLKPEDLSCLDPCMGSGHILVYMFDVLEQIYTSVGYSEREAAKAILENNIYGLDIDDRAYQLAYFAVMMKARQYNRRILTSGIKAHVYSIQESNGITKNQLQEMGENLSPDEKAKALSQAEKLVELFHDAKEYGSILNIPEMDWDLLRRFATPKETFGQTSLNWNQEASKRILQLIDQGEVMAKKYWVTCTNPPYAAVAGLDENVNKYVRKYYADCKSDMFAVFIEKCNMMLLQSGFQAMITQHSWMFLSDFRKIRAHILRNTFINFVHLGARAFDDISGEVVQSVAFVISKREPNSYVGKYVRLVNEKQPEIKEKKFFNKNFLYLSRQDNFLRIDGNIIAYWLSERMFKLISEQCKLEKYGDARQGLTTTDNNKFLRLWFEIEHSRIDYLCDDCNSIIARGTKWFPYIKGGQFRKWSSVNEYVVNYENNGKEIKDNVMKKYKYLSNPGFVVKNTDHYFKHGITWNDVSTSKFCCRYVKNGFIFSDAGPMYFSNDDIVMLGYFNSNVFQSFADIICQGLHYSTGHIPRIPYKDPSFELKRKISGYVQNNLLISSEDWDSFETSWDFTNHPLVTYKSGAGYADVPMDKWSYHLSDAYHSWEMDAEARFNQMKKNEEELNRIFIDIYDLQDELTPEEEDEDVTVRKADLGRDIRSLISYAVGCMFGRYSLDEEGLVYAGGHFDIEKYRSFEVDPDNIIPITDEEYFNDDIVGRFVEFIKTVYGKDTLEENLEYIAKALGNKGDTSRDVIRNYFEKDFIKDHIKIYKKRPIYWLFNSGKQNGFKALIYMHRYNENTVSNVRTEYLHKVQDVYVKTIEDDQYTIDHSSSKSDINKARKHITKLQKQLDETKQYDMALAHIANERISIDLDDGVKVNYAKFQDIEIINDNGKKVKVNLLEKI